VNLGLIHLKTFTPGDVSTYVQFDFRSNIFRFCDLVKDIRRMPKQIYFWSPTPFLRRAQAVVSHKGKMGWHIPFYGQGTCAWRALNENQLSLMINQRQQFWEKVVIFYDPCVGKKFAKNPSNEIVGWGLHRSTRRTFSDMLSPGVFSLSVLVWAATGPNRPQMPIFQVTPPSNKSS